MCVEKMRLVKYLAVRGIGSRRSVDRFIQDCGVWVNDRHIFDPAYAVSEEDHIVVQGKAVDGPCPAFQFFLFYKPRGMLTTHHDERGRLCVGDVLKHLPNGLKTVGRLDRESEGLLLLTTDGDFKRWMELPRTGLSRQYQVTYRGTLTSKDLEELHRGKTVEGIRYGPCRVQCTRGKRGAVRLCTMMLREGKNREIRRLLASCGCEVIRLVRIAYGPFSLGTLEPGDVQSLTFS